MTTTKFKLKWLHKRKDKLKGKVERAFFEVRKELIDLVKEAGDKPTPFIKYLAAFIGTSDVISFIKIIIFYKNFPSRKRASFSLK